MWYRRWPLRWRNGSGDQGRGEWIYNLEGKHVLLILDLVVSLFGGLFALGKLDGHFETLLRGIGELDVDTSLRFIEGFHLDIVYRSRDEE